MTTLYAAPYSVIIDDVNSPILYIGEAPIGSLVSSPSWRIKKLDITTGVLIIWADGNSLFDNIWDDRATLTYS